MTHCQIESLSGDKNSTLPLVITVKSRKDEQFFPKHSSCRKSALVGAQWLSGRMHDPRPRGSGFEPHQRHCIVSLSKNINPRLVLVQPR